MSADVNYICEFKLVGYIYNHNNILINLNFILDFYSCFLISPTFFHSPPHLFSRLLCSACHW